MCTIHKNYKKSTKGLLTKYSKKYLKKARKFGKLKSEVYALE